MTEKQLLERIEEQASEISRLKDCIKILQAKVDVIPTLLTETEQLIYRRMANGAVNCGPSYGCSLARRLMP